MFQSVLLGYLQWFHLIAPFFSDVPLFVCSTEHHCQGSTSQPLPLALPLDFESVSGKLDRPLPRQAGRLPMKIPIWSSFAPEEHLLSLPRPPDKHYHQEATVQSASHTMDHNERNVTIWNPDSIPESRLDLTQPLISWTRSDQLTTPIFQPNNKNRNHPVCTLLLPSSAVKLKNGEMVSSHQEAWLLCLTPPLSFPQSKYNSHLLLMSSSTLMSGSRQPKKKTTQRRGPPPTPTGQLFVPPSPHSKLVFPDPVPVPIHTTKEEIFHFMPKWSLREALFHRNDPALAEAFLCHSVQIQGLVYAGTADNDKRVMTNIYDCLDSFDIKLDPFHFVNPASPMHKAFYNRTTDNNATKGMMGSTRKTMSLIFNLQEPLPAYEITHRTMDVLPPTLTFEIAALKQEKECRTVDIATHFTATPQIPQMNETMWLNTIDSANSAAINWHPLFYVTWIHEELDLFAAAIQQDLDHAIRQHLTPEQYDYFKTNLIVSPSRPHLTEQDNRFQNCNGSGIGFWLYSDPRDVLHNATRRRILILLMGSPKTKVAHGTIHGIRTLLFQSSSGQNKLVVSNLTLPTDLTKPTRWFLAFDNLPFEINTHVLYVLLVHGYGLPADTVLNIAHDHDMLNDPSLSTFERGIPRTVVMLSSPEIVHTFLHYKAEITHSISSLFPPDMPSRHPQRDDTFALAITTLNMKKDHLPQLPPTALIGQCPDLRLTRHALLALSHDSSAVPADPVPEIALRSSSIIATPQPSTPSPTTPASRPSTLLPMRAQASLSAWQSPTTATPQQPSRKHGRGEEDTEHDMDITLDSSQTDNPFTTRHPPNQPATNPAPTPLPSLDQCITVIQTSIISRNPSDHFRRLFEWVITLAPGALNNNSISHMEYENMLLEVLEANRALEKHKQSQPDGSDFYQVDDRNQEQDQSQDNI
jgi:hypothetical protein